MIHVDTIRHQYCDDPLSIEVVLRGCTPAGRKRKTVRLRLGSAEFAALVQVMKLYRGRQVALARRHTLRAETITSAGVT